MRGLFGGTRPPHTRRVNFIASGLSGHEGPWPSENPFLPDLKVHETDMWLYVRWAFQAVALGPAGGVVVGDARAWDRHVP